MRDYFKKNDKVHFVFPIDGDCLNCYDGKESQEGLLVLVQVMADKNADIEINEQKSIYNGEYFEAKVLLEGYRNTLFAIDKNNPEENAKIAVYKLKDCIGKYRISSDDNILFLKDINDNKDKYNSIFENPYLAIYKEAHDKYDAMVHLNIFYETDEMVDFENKREYFNLAMMTDKFKDEWKQNADWLHLSFHARKEKPDMPYKNTTIKEIGEDCKAVNEQILRFAGEDTLAVTTTVHWGECNEAGMRTLRGLGIKGASGYFEIAEGVPLVAYFYPKGLVEHVGNRDFWKDNEEDIMYGRIDLVLNRYKLEQIAPLLDEIKKNAHRAGYIELMIHEQYFFEDYMNYIPEFKEMILSACKWAKDNGYEGKAMKDIMFE